MSFTAADVVRRPGDCARLLNELQADVDRLKGGIEMISGCESHHPLDVVAAARNLRAGRKWDDTGEVVKNAAPTGAAYDLHVKLGQPMKAAVLYDGAAYFDGNGRVTISVDEFNRLVAGQRRIE
jgi:hypothetical protein